MLASCGSGGAGQRSAGECTEPDQLLGPLDSFRASAFDLPVPRDPGWLAWGDRLRQSDSAETFLGCAGED